MTKLTAGIVPVTLQDETHELKATARAILRISDMEGGITGALTKVQQLDFRAIVQIIKHGTNADDALSKRLDELVFETGVVNLMAPLVKYLMLLARGGHPEEGEADAGKALAATAA
jgi:hypothetical protein